MSQNFKDRYNEFLDGDPGNQDHSQDVAPKKEHPYIDYYQNYHPTRNICFIQRNGQQIFLNYSYLVSCEYIPDQNTIIASFTTHTVTLTGLFLEELFRDLMQYIPRVINSVDERYNSIAAVDQPVVNEIKVLQN